MHAVTDKNEWYCTPIYAVLCVIMTNYCQSVPSDIDTRPRPTCSLGKCPQV